MRHLLTSYATSRPSLELELCRFAFSLVGNFFTVRWNGEMPTSSILMVLFMYSDNKYVCFRKSKANVQPPFGLAVWPHFAQYDLVFAFIFSNLMIAIFVLHLHNFSCTQRLVFTFEYIKYIEPTLVSSKVFCLSLLFFYYLFGDCV